jgi:hypothetical protein
VAEPSCGHIAPWICASSASTCAGSTAATKSGAASRFIAALRSGAKYQQSDELTAFVGSHPSAPPLALPLNSDSRCVVGALSVEVNPAFSSSLFVTRSSASRAVRRSLAACERSSRPASFDSIAVSCSV